MDTRRQNLRSSTKCRSSLKACRPATSRRGFLLRWITREHVKVDRVACPWLIRRFIDSDPEFVFLPKDTDWAAIEDGIVFDVPGCELGHHGESVSFDAILDRYRIDDAALRLLAEIVRAADSRPAHPHPAGE